MPPARTFEELVLIMDRLRDPGGCPWDREQTWKTLRGYLLEECYEVVDALDRADPAGLCEELGDLLFQIVFLSRIAREEGSFTAADVIEGIAAKMIRRHPHVFGDETASDSAAVLLRWEQIKKREKEGASDRPGAPSVLDGIPKTLPALQSAQRLGTKAARVGFDWPDAAAAAAKLEEEHAELRAALASGDTEAIREEIGDTLFTLAMLARKLDCDAEGALAAANVKFRARFGAMERELGERGVPLEDAGLALMDRLWEDAKRVGRKR